MNTTTTDCTIRALLSDYASAMAEALFVPTAKDRREAKELYELGEYEALLQETVDTLFPFVSTASNSAPRDEFERAFRESLLTELSRPVYRLDRAVKRCALRSPLRRPWIYVRNRTTRWYVEGAVAVGKLAVTVVAVMDV